MWSIDSVKSYCINLDRRKDRWDRMIQQPEVKRIPNLKRFSGIDGQTIDIKTDPRISTLCRLNIQNKTRRSHDMLDSPGGVGCALSHIKLWQQLVQSHDNVIFIVEDDLVMNAGEWTKVREIYKNNEFLHDSTGWGIWSVGNLRCGAGPGKPYPDPLKKEDKWLDCKEFVGFNSYFISRSGAEALLQQCFPIQHHIDWSVGFYAQTHPEFRIVWNKSLNLDQDMAMNQKELSDIRTKDTCDICDVPSDYEKTHMLVSFLAVQSITTLSLVTLGILVAGFFAFGSSGRRTRRLF